MTQDAPDAAQAANDVPAKPLRPLIDHLLRFARCRRLLATSALVATANARASGNNDAGEVPMRTLAIVFGMAMLGGLVSWISKVGSGTISGYSLTQLVGELTTSAFSGLICWLLCRQAGLSDMLTWALVGIAGHMGTRAIMTFERFAEQRWGDLGAPAKTLPNDPPKE